MQHCPDCRYENDTHEIACPRGKEVQDSRLARIEYEKGWSDGRRGREANTLGSAYYLHGYRMGKEFPKTPQYEDELVT